VTRPTSKLLDDILRAAEVAYEIVRRGRERFELDPVAQFGAEIEHYRGEEGRGRTACRP
jgi:hypothetical protein